MSGMYYYVLASFQTKDEKKIKYYEYASNYGNVKATMKLANYYKMKLFDKGIDSDSDKSIDSDSDKMIAYFRIGANGGNLNAIKSLGEYYREKNNVSEMIHYYELAKLKKDTESINQLAFYYDKIKDNDKKIENLKLSASYGNIDAMLLLGHHYSESFRDDRDNRKMIHYYQMAINKKNTDAMDLLALYHKNEKQFIFMVEYFTESAKHGSEFGMIQLGDYYRDNRIYSEMVVYYEMAKNKKKNTHAMVELGLYYSSYEQNDAFMLANFEMASHAHVFNPDGGTMATSSRTQRGSDNVFAMNALGEYYRKKENIPKMIHYYEMAIRHGSIDAMNALGEYYRVKENIPKMLQYYEMAKLKNDKNAIDNLALYYKETKKFDLMLENFYLSMKLGSISGLQHIAKYYREIGEKNIPILFDYYQIVNEQEESNIKNSKSDIISWVCNEMDSELLTPPIIKYCIKEEHDFIFELARCHPKNEIFSTICLLILNEEEDNVCSICLEPDTEKNLFPYDCYVENNLCKSHVHCIDCYAKIDKCSLCQIPRNPQNAIFCNIIR